MSKVSSLIPEMMFRNIDKHLVHSKLRSVMCDGICGFSTGKITYVFITIIIILSLFYPSDVLANTTGARSMTTMDGLQDDFINVIYPAKDGFVWFGTKLGVDRFDGNHIVNYSYPEHSQNHNKVNSIVTANNGIVFFGCADGLYALPKSGTTLDHILPNTIECSVNIICTGDGDDLWVGTKKGLFQVNTKTLETNQILFGKDTRSSSNEVVGLYYDPHNKGIWVATVRQICFYSVKSKKTLKYRNPKKVQYQNLTKLGDSFYLRTKGQGIIPFNFKLKEFGEALNFGNNIITSLSTTPSGHLLIVSDCEGIFIYSPDDEKIIAKYDNENSFLRSSSIYSAIIDHRNILWVGYYQMGVDYVPNTFTIFDSYSNPNLPNLNRKEIRTLAIEPDFKLVGTRSGLFYINEKDGSVRKINTPDNKLNIVFSIQKWNGLYYIATYRGGLYTFNPATKQLSNKIKGSPLKGTDTCFDIQIDKHNNLWFGTSIGVLRLDTSNKWTHINSSNSQLYSGNIYKIYFDSRNRGWFSSGKGLSIYDGERVNNWSFPKNIISTDRFNAIYEDNSHNLYFAPSRGKVIRGDIELKKFEQLSFNTPRDPVVTFITETPDGQIWFGTNIGLIVYDKKECYQYFYGNGGKPNLFYTPCQPVKMPDGDIWMASYSGLLHMNYEKLKALSKKQYPQIEITSVRFGDEDVSHLIDQKGKHKTLQLKGGRRGLEISVSDFSYMHPADIKFEYMLEGHKKQKWTQIEASRKIHLDQLPAKDYKFRVRLQGHPETEKELDITIKSEPVVITWLVMGAVVILAVAIILWKRSRRKSTNEETDAEIQTEAYKKTKMSGRECKAMQKKVDAVMREQKPYLDPDLKLSHLAALTGVSAFSLSFLFNQYLKTTYYNYVNTYRLEEFKRMIEKEDTSKYTLSAMADKCGFSSRTSFFRYFKNETGITPAEYLKKNA